MAGMLQIITYLLCVYLVFKGLEILQIALMSSRPARGGGITIGILAFVIALGAAYLFTHMIDAQAQAISNRVSP